MKSIIDYISEAIVNEEDKKNDETITDEKSFREWAKAKFKEVFGDKLDEKRFKFTVDGFLKADENKELVDKGEWGELVGKMNASFAK